MSDPRTARRTASFPIVMRRDWAWRLPWMLALSAGGAGCCQPCPTRMVPLEQLVAEYNDNAAKVPRLWARAKVQVAFADAKGRRFTWGSTLLPPNALLHLRKAEGLPRRDESHLAPPDGPLGPHEFLLHGREASQEVFRAGISTADRVYYFWVHFGEHGWGLFGRNELAGAPGAAAMPIDAHQLLAVLGITELPSDFTRPPTVLLRMEDTPCRCAYVLTYIDRQPLTGKILSRREVHFDWHDQRPRRPFRIDFLDEQGQRVMTAELKDYRPIQMEDVDPPPGSPPLMPTDIRIAWPQRNSEIRLVLSEMTTADRVDPEVFLFWKWLPAAVRASLESVDPLPGRREVPGK